jgi:hypothetical protein
MAFHNFGNHRLTFPVELCEAIKLGKLFARFCDARGVVAGHGRAGARPIRGA